MFKWLRERRRAKIKEEPFPDAWREILHQRFPLYDQLTTSDQHTLQGLIQVFLAEKRFEGCGGLAITDEIRVTIAAQACLPLLHRKNDNYRGLKSVLVYPSTYFGSHAQQSAHGVVTEEKSARLGESWQMGVVVLSWDSVLGGAANPDDGQNVVIHEFAHQLDQQSGAADGAPVLAAGASFAERSGRYDTWAKILSEEYETLQRRARKGRKTVLDKYGGTHPAEFFAVATECFFEKPDQLKKKHPELFKELKQYYQQDPTTWGN
jgi:Mlc titration factor MtfA (ptsG expression regulator)